MPKRDLSARACGSKSKPRAHLWHAQEDRQQAHKSPLGQVLLRAWAWGGLSATTVQALARAALESGAQGGDLAVMAAAGCHGCHPGNISRDLCRKLVPLLASRPAFEVPCEVSTKEPQSGRMRLASESQHILLPHEILADVCSSLEAERLLGLSKREQFWKDFEESGAMQDRPELLEARAANMLPLILHTDGAPYTDTGSLLQLSMRSLLGEGPVTETQFLLAGLPKACTTTATWHPVYEAVVRSLECLYYGDISAMGDTYDRSRCKQLPPKAVVLVVWQHHKKHFVPYFEL